MVEVSNKVLSVLVLGVLVVVVTATIVNFNTTHRYEWGGLSGFATSDTGYVNLTINQTLAIAVDTTNSTVNFGTCSPRAGVSYSCISNDTAICDGGVGGSGNCTGDTTTPQFIRVDNVGNVNANITMSSECNATSFIGGTNPGFSFITTQCNLTGVSSWTSFSTSAQNVCNNLSYLGGKLRLYANVTIPYDAVGSTGTCSGAQSTITFTAALG